MFSGARNGELVLGLGISSSTNGTGGLAVMMRRARGYKYLILELGADAAAILLGLAAAYWFRFHAGVIPLRPWDPRDYLVLYPLAFVIWLFSLRLTHCYRNHPMVLTFNMARRLLKGSLLAVALIVVLEHFFRIAEYSRLMYPLSLVMVMGSLLALRALLQRFIIGLLREGIARARVLIVGTGPIARRLAARCRIHPEYGYEVVGLVAENPEQVGRTIEGTGVVGGVAELRDLIKRHGAHEIFVTQSNLPPSDYLKMALDSEQEIAQVRIVPNMVEMMMGHVFYDELAGIPLFMLKETPLRGWNAFLKRLMDVAISAAGLAVVTPFLPYVAWRIRRDSPGPVFYRQKRVGIDGHEFSLLKLRTMPVNAEPNGPVWGDRFDPRCTGFGRFLRRWDLDELPQLWNVFRGDMSLVGPRPERPAFVQQFKELYSGYMGRLRVRAGITGWAQVHGLRGDTPVTQRLQYDLYYIENWSFWIDLKILLLTLVRWRSSSRISRPDTQGAPTPAPQAAPDAKPARDQPFRA